MKKILNIEEVKKLQSFYQYKNGDYSYRDKDGIYHLVRDSKKICSGKDVFSYENGDYKYSDKYGIWYLIRDGKELCSGIFVSSHYNGDYDYKDEDGKTHIFNKDGEKIY